jgi:hypothetical protein
MIFRANKLFTTNRQNSHRIDKSDLAIINSYNFLEDISNPFFLHKFEPVPKCYINSDESRNPILVL